MDAKPVMVLVTDPDECAAVRRNDLWDPIGGALPDGSIVAYKHSIVAYRARLANKQGDMK